MDPNLQAIVPVLSHPDGDEKSKVEVDHLEDSQGNATVLVSAYADLGFLATLKTFKRTSAICFMALFTACSDGYQYSLPGNLVAEKSFIGKSDSGGFVLFNCDDTG